MDEIPPISTESQELEIPETGEGFAEEALSGNLEDQPEITLEDLPL
ncbi:MAG: hypothetical protein AAB343_04340 [Patescibacteria group bacterium]